DAGLIAPIALVVAAVIAAARLFFHAGEQPRPFGALARLRRLDSDARAQSSALWLTLPLALALWLVATASIATRLLGSDVPASAAGAAIALAALALFWIASQVALGASRPLAQ